MKPKPVKKVLTHPKAVRVPAYAPRWVMPAVKTSMVLTDIALTVASFCFAFYFREGQAVSLPGQGLFAWTGAFAPYGALLPFVIPIRLIVLANYDLYRLRGEFSILDDLIRIFKAAAVGSLLIVAVAFLYRGGLEFRAFSYARSVFVLDFILAFFSLALVRIFFRAAQTLVRRRDLNLIPTLVVGRGPGAELFIREIRERPELGYRVIGVVENGPLTSDVPESYEGVPVITNLKGLPDAIRESGANEVIIADQQVGGNALFDVMMRCGQRGVEFRIAPSLFNVLPRKTEIDQIGALPMITLFRSPLSQVARIVKRTSDLLIATSASLILLPLALIVALLIKLDSKGPILYLQERVGMDGRVFLFYKFRTMKPQVDDAVHREFQRRFIAGQPEANFGDEDRPVYKLHADDRITRVGHWLRRTSLDEVPQLLNVLRGDMSIVGPRPPIAYEVEAYELWHRKRLDMKPGLTGLWQVSGRNRLPFEEMVRLDLYYIENWSLLLDVKIILRTIIVILKGEGY
jgi:exopolysaccharide biosynthesis polyprenyl glycosylphosphotransferase